MKTYWITFYSYKGGVGRTLALANVGACLANKGRKVVLIDFDLEAPGLDSFEHFSSSKGKNGVVEYVSDFEQNKICPSIENYVYECPLPKKVRGKIWVMPAGKKDGLYNQKRADINWSRLFESDTGTLFLENWKAAIELNYEPDYVLIDSRTGLTDVGGICTLGFPDLLVMLYSLNQQNVQGTAAVARAILGAEPQRAPQVAYVVSPMPNLNPDSSDLFKQRYKSACDTLGRQPHATITYYSVAALEERLFVLSDQKPEPTICSDYADLTEKLTLFNRSGLEFLSEQVDLACVDSDDEKIDRLINILSRDYPKNAEANYLLAKLNVVLRKQNTALHLCEEALQLEPTFKPAYDFLESRLLNLKQHRKLLELILTYESYYKDGDTDDYESILGTKSRCMMCLEMYEQAFSTMELILNLPRSAPLHKDLLLVYEFNKAEARRRLNRKINQQDWGKILVLFDQTVSAINDPSPTQANRYQAMHIPYALLGDLSKANEMLDKSIAAAETISDIDDIFSVQSYQEESKAIFIEHVSAMRRSLQLGKLWDGMKLPAD